MLAAEWSALSRDWWPHFHTNFCVGLSRSIWQAISNGFARQPSHTHSDRTNDLKEEVHG